jgi:hypothetical protein
LVTHVVNPVNLAKDLLEVTGLYVESILLVWVFLSGVFLLAVTSGLRKPTMTTMSGLSRPNGESTNFSTVDWLCSGSPRVLSEIIS